MSKVKKAGTRRLRFFVAGVCLTLMLLVSVGAVPAFAAEPESASGSLPAGVTPVVILSGSDYDMGYQYSQQVIDLYGKWFYERKAGVYEPFSDAEILALKAYQWYLKSNFPEMIGYIDGMAAGATAAGLPMTYAEALARLTGTTAFPGTEPPGSEEDTLPPACATWAAWGKTTKDGGLITSHTSDAKTDLVVTIVAFPDVGNSYISAKVASSSMNDKGVWMSINTGGATRAIDKASGYDIVPATGFAAEQHALRFANTAKEALDLYQSWKTGLPRQFLFADVTGDAYVLERSPAFKAVRKAGDFGEGDFLYMRNNFFTDEGGEADLGGLPGKFYPHGGWSLDPPSGVENPGDYCDFQMASVRTNQTMYNMFSQYQGKLDVEFAKMLLRFAGEMPKDPFSIKEFRTTRARTWETPLNLENSVDTICLPDDGDKGTMYLCTGPAGRVGTPYEPGTDDDYYQIANTYTFYELGLTSSPADVVEAAMLTAKSDTAKAYQKLMWLNYGDVGYEGLRTLFDTAVAEYYEGVNWTSRAVRATGNDQFGYYAQAATAFTRAQAHAQQVSEALADPPVTPSDLGLKRYKAREYGF